MKYKNTQVVFQEVPDRISLAINISGCPIHCPGCHSKWLWEDQGTTLDEKELDSLIKVNPGINCVAFMGGDADIVAIKNLCRFVKQNYPNLKTCWYSGREVSQYDEIKRLEIEPFLDYIKMGPYIKERGGLENPKTNQVFLEIRHFSDGSIIRDDITGKFWH